MTPESAPIAVCGICGEPIERGDATVITSTNFLHVACVEQSAAAA